MLRTAQQKCSFPPLFCFPPVCVLPIDASRFDEFLPKKKKKEIRQKMAARPEHNLSRSQGNLTYKDFPSKKHRAGTQSWAMSRAEKLPTTLSQLQQQQQQQHTAVFDMCASVYTSFPLESVTHAGGSRGSLVGGLWLTPGALRGYSAPAFCQILRLSHSPGLTGC